MSKNNPYKHFPNYVLRIPLFSFSSFKKLTAGKKISDKDFKKACTNPIIQEAIFLASPSLYDSIKRWLEEDEKAKKDKEDKKKEQKLKLSILRYLSRMSSRCTPFGLFAGCALGTFKEQTNLDIKGANQNKRHTRLDMNYLVALSQDLVKTENIKKQLLFFPNSSIYKSGSQLRYIEYRYVNSMRHHSIVGVDDNEYLLQILSLAKEGALLTDLAKSLVDDEISIDDANEFIEELVSSQLLISELEPSVSGPEFLEQIYAVLGNLDGVEDTLNKLRKASDTINKIDNSIGNNPQDYLDLTESLESFGTEFKLKYMFQTDMVTSYNHNTLDKKVAKDIHRAFTLFNKISIPPKSSLLSDFKDAFSERFEEREVSLATALDAEVGLGYIQNQNNRDINPLVDDFIIHRQQSKRDIMDVKWTRVSNILQKKILKAYQNNDYTVTITDQDFKDYETYWDDIPDTISFIVQLVKVNGEEKIKMRGSFGSSAANLLGRFCHGDKELYEYTQSIVDTEQQINSEKLLAEIVHLPESRVGNILMRPDFRFYEIPYLAKSIKPKSHQLPIDDLMISIKNGRKIHLRSKKYNKEVIPHMTNAHNFARNSLPIYHFLCDMQTNGKRNRIGFGWGPFTDDYEFLPRVEYQNIILYLATWNLKYKHIKELINNQDDDEKLYTTTISMQDQLNIPQYIILIDGDNELVINLKNLTSVRMLLNAVNKRKYFTISEFLFDEDGIVKKEEEYYTNQVVVSFYNEEKLRKSQAK